MTRNRPRLIAALVASDSLGLALALVLSHRIASSISIWYAPAAVPATLWLLMPVGIALFALSRLYVLDEILEGPIEYGRVINGCTFASLSLIVLGFWGKELQELAPSRTLIGLLWILSIALVGGGRFLARRIVRHLRRRGLLLSRAVLVGLGGPGLTFARHFEQMRHAGVKIVGFVDDFLPPGTPVVGDLKVLGPPGSLHAILAETGAHEAIVVPTAMAWESYQDLIRRLATLNGYTIRLVAGSGDLLASVRPHRLGSIPMMTVERVRIVGLDRVLKVTLEMSLALLAALLSAPLVLAAYVAGALRKERVFRPVRFFGRGGKVFTTGVLNGIPPAHWTSGLLDRTGAARFPQFISVLLGRMNVVGPRPIPVERRREYADWLPGLLTLRPGLVGPWSIRPSASVEEELEASLLYIRNYTIWLDLDVLIRLALRVFSRRRPEAPGPEEDAAVGDRVAAHR
jgi:lipopolysaccharide/colanic/teichoic acid biosynthesis glycosyltransferase